MTGTGTRTRTMVSLEVAVAESPFWLDDAMIRLHAMGTIAEYDLQSTSAERVVYDVVMGNAEDNLIRVIFLRNKTTGRFDDVAAFTQFMATALLGQRKTTKKMRVENGRLIRWVE